MDHIRRAILALEDSIGTLHSTLRVSFSFLLVVLFATFWNLLAIAQSSPGASKLGLAGCVMAQQTLPYSIRFENLSTATAPAQQVVISDPLNLSTLDPNSVSLDRITFGNVQIVPPPGLRSYAGQVDLRPGRNLLVNFSAAVDPFTGVLTWYFASIDPATGQPPVDPMVGFLPPNITPPEGEGSVLFTVAARPLPDGTTIQNRATVTFDSGAPVETPYWSNTVDATPPESHVLPLAANQDSASFTVHWEAVGSHSDLLDFSIYVSEAGGAFRAWRLNTTATADTFMAPGGHTYAFYSIARDSCGNVESAPASPDAQTYSRVAVEDAGHWMLALEGARPNPTTDFARVWFTLPSREPAVLEVVDVAGRRLLRCEVGQLGPGRHSMDLSGSVGKPGLYFLSLTQGGRLMRARMVIIG